MKILRSESNPNGEEVLDAYRNRTLLTFLREGEKGGIIKGFPVSLRPAPGRPGWVMLTLRLENGRPGKKTTVFYNPDITCVEPPDDEG